EEAERGAQRVQLLISRCHSNLGNAAEAQHRIGDAFRHWSRSLSALDVLGLSRGPEGERLRRLIRLWHEMPRVWVSYSHRDKKKVDRVVQKLRRAEIDVTYDTQFLGGHMIQRQIQLAISRCPKGVVFWSESSQKSGWVQYEVELLKKKRLEDAS